MGASFPKVPCLENCLQRVDLICDDRGLKRPTGEKAVKARIQCDSECNEINAISTIQHASDGFVSTLADSFCGGPRGSGKKPGHYSVEIRGTGTETMDSGNGSGRKTQKIEQRISTADRMIDILEMRRDSRVWYQSFSDHLGGPSEPSHQKVDALRHLVKDAKARRANGDLRGARESIDQAIKTVFQADDEYDSYQRTSIDHAEKVAAIQGVTGLVLFVVGTAGTGLAYALEGTAAAGTTAGGAEIISLVGRTASSPPVQEALKRAAILLLGLKAVAPGDGRNH